MAQEGLDAFDLKRASAQLPVICECSALLDSLRKGRCPASFRNRYRAHFVAAAEPAF